MFSRSLLLTIDRGNFESVVILFEPDAVMIKEALTAKEYGYIRVNEYDRRSEAARLMSQLKRQVGDETFGMLH